TLDGTFVRSCEPGERHLEVRVGNVETSTGARQVFAAVAGADTDIAALLIIVVTSPQPGMPRTRYWRLSPMAVLG
ncbi:MAG TPA: hypothetical protein VMB73_12190, partial [Acetobacteraceae bacterium]|nr:hypothetical protein [Acetobacteraceae bacterium]